MDEHQFNLWKTPDDPKPFVVTNHESRMDPKTAIAWALMKHTRPDGTEWTVREQAQGALDFLHGNGYVIVKQRDLEAVVPANIELGMG